MSSTPEHEHSERPAADQPQSTRSEEPREYDREPAVAPEPKGRSKAAGRLLGALIGLVLTPVAIAMLTYGGFRYLELTTAGEGFDHDRRGLATLAAGALLLLIVALTGALSAAGPLLAGLVWGLAPAAVYLAYPEDTLSRVRDLPIVPADAEAGTVTWLAVGAFLAVGVTLVGSAFSVVMRRR